MNTLSQRKTVRILMYAMLLISAATSFFWDDKLWAKARSGALPAWVALTPIMAFTAFVVVYAIDRWLLVRRRGYPQGRAFLQVALALTFLSLLWPRQAVRYRLTTEDAHNPAVTVVDLLSHPDKAVRRAACELLAWRREQSASDDIETLLAHETDGLTRQVCTQASRQLQGIREVDD